jgi:hypothetical protein
MASLCLCQCLPRMIISSQQYNASCGEGCVANKWNACCEVEALTTAFSCALRADFACGMGYLCLMQTWQAMVMLQCRCFYHVLNAVFGLAVCHIHPPSRTFPVLSTWAFSRQSRWPVASAATYTFLLDSGRMATECFCFVTVSYSQCSESQCTCTVHDQGFGYCFQVLMQLLFSTAQRHVLTFGACTTDTWIGTHQLCKCAWFSSPAAYLSD